MLQAAFIRDLTRFRRFCLNQPVGEVRIRKALKHAFGWVQSVFAISCRRLPLLQAIRPATTYYVHCSTDANGTQFISGSTGPR